MHSPGTSQSCPRCGTQVPVHSGYVTWCHSCGWNVAAPSAAYTPPGRIGRLYERVGRRLGDRLAGELLTDESLQPRLTLSKGLAYSIAVGVYAVAIAFAVAGLALLVLGFPNPVAIGVGVVLVAIAVLMRPRFGKAPDEGLISREEAPRLHELADEIASALETEPVDLVQIAPAFNAQWGVYGLRRTRVLGVGLALLAVLEPQERVALIAHELAHAKNGDSTRGFFMGSALGSLEELYVLLAPNEFLYEVENPDLGPIERIANWILWLISRPLLGLLLLQLHLLLRDSQRAEYLADALAARVAGGEATIALQEKLLLASTVDAAVQHAARPGENGETDLFEELVTATISIPERERERRRRVARLEQARLSDTHPPTAKRIALIEGRPPASLLVALDEGRSAAIDAELAGRRRAAQRELIDEYRDSLYAG